MSLPSDFTVGGFFILRKELFFNLRGFGEAADVTNW